MGGANNVSCTAGIGHIAVEHLLTFTLLRLNKATLLEIKSAAVESLAKENSVTVHGADLSHLNMLSQKLVFT